MEKIIFSLIIPIYENEDYINETIERVFEINKILKKKLEVVFVIDGGKDKSLSILKEKIIDLEISSQLIVHSRNFGSLQAIRTGLQYANGEYFCIMAADLQEPTELIINIFENLQTNKCDIVMGERISREDPIISKFFSFLFWWFYKKFIIKDIPIGGIDIFGCNSKFCNELLKFKESRSSLISLIFWIGFKRKFIPYSRLKRTRGKSQWTFKKKIDYMLDSIFSFTDYPITLLRNIGLAGCVLSFFLSIFVISGYISGEIPIRGYTTIILAVLFFGSLNIFGLGLVGTYAWRTYENTKNRPLSIVSEVYKNNLNKKILTNNENEFKN